MAALHAALQTLAPVEFFSLPVDEPKSFLEEAFSNSQLLIDSVPLPSDDSPAAGRSRANTTSSVASSASEISASSARPAPPNPEHAPLQKEWGKPIKLSAKENPLGISVFKLAGKDGKGAWFARRSVHEGLGFAKWKKALEREFPSSLEVQGGPGEGSVRGIGGERIVESKEVKGVGIMQVLHLAAQFPGPTTPRDFVTLLVTSSFALPESRSWSPDAPPPSGTPPPRHYMVVSKPCVHPECPPREGFIRGEYESIEFIREVPVNPPPVPKLGRRRASSTTAANPALRNIDGPHPGDGNQSDQTETRGRQRGKTISFAQGPPGAKGPQYNNGLREEEAETNPVEWIMICRSDPGGSVPRWMVERGTPAGIVADAIKFLDWACKTEHGTAEDEEEEEDESCIGHGHTKSEDHGHDLQVVETNGLLTGLDGSTDESKDGGQPRRTISFNQSLGTIDRKSESASLLATMTNAVGAGLSAYTPTVISSHLLGAQHTEPNPPPISIHEAQPSPAPSQSLQEDDAASTTSSSESVASFATASVGEEDEGGTNSTAKDTPSPTPTAQDKELSKLHARKAKLDEQLARTRAASASTTSQLSAKEAAALAKAEEKHARELAKQEERYRKEVAKIEARRARDVRKTEEKRRKQEDRDERVRWGRERDELKSQLDRALKERDQLKGLVGELQKENTTLVMRLGEKGVLARPDGGTDKDAASTKSASASVKSDPTAEKVGAPPAVTVS